MLCDGIAVLFQAAAKAFSSIGDKPAPERVSQHMNLIPLETQRTETGRDCEICRTKMRSGILRCDIVFVNDRDLEDVHLRISVGALRFSAPLA
jgi:hypothetical protein